MIEFLLNGKLQQIVDIDPCRTLLDHLREDLHQSGTKEGCASGDCGACTVALGELADDGSGHIGYKSINACITPLANVHAKHVVTVEYLKQNEQLHPAQQAMIDCHGSQCGFCTPGFVMSMFVLKESQQQIPDRQMINVSLGGNLCRCTGYRPIIDAAVKMYTPESDQEYNHFADNAVEWGDKLKQMNATEMVSISQSSKQYFAPHTPEQLGELMAQYPTARLVAGGTDLSIELTQHLADIETLIYTGRVAVMRAVDDHPAYLEIGAAATYSEFTPTLLEYFPQLQNLLERLGSLQIRNQGTLGGNIGNASPIGDMPPVLLALNASLILQSSNGLRELPLQQFFLGYKQTALTAGEFIRSVKVPKQGPSLMRAYKISKRFEDDISAICAAFNVYLNNNVVEQVNIAFGGMAETPKRASHCEAALIGQEFSIETIAKARKALAKDFQPISDFRASSEYRLLVSQNLLDRLLIDSQAEADTMVEVYHA